MNNKTDIDVQYVSPLKKICMTIGELPSSYLETMSYYEMLVWFTEFLKNKVIPTINNNAEAVQELQSLYEELRTYVNDYFDNLDVQDEINNKLDAMAESGQLTDIIAQYLGLAGMIAFDTVADMKAAENLVNGSKCHTLGYSSVNDGGASLYKVRTITNDDVVDNATIIALYDDSLIAELISPETLNIKQVGGTSDGTSILTALTNAKKTSAETIYFPDGTYLLDGTIILSKNLKGHNATINMNRSNGDEFGIEFTGNNLKIENLKFHLISSNKLLEIRDSNNVSILNCKFDTETTGRTAGGILDVYQNNHNILVENCYFETHATGTGGIWIREGITSGNSSNILFNNCKIIGDTVDETIGIWGWKGTVENVTIENCSITRPLNANITNQMPITIGAEGSTKNCGLINCTIDVYTASNAIIKTGYGTDDGLFVKDCVINTHMATLANGLVYIQNGDGNGIEIKDCTINMLNTASNPDIGSSLKAKLIGCKINGSTQLNINRAYLVDCEINNKPSETISGKCARGIYAKNTTINGLNRTGSSFIQCLSTIDSVYIDSCVLNYSGSPQTYFVFADGTGYSTSEPLIVKDSIFKENFYAPSTNISKGYVIGNYTSASSIGTISSNVSTANNTTSFSY